MAAAPRHRLLRDPDALRTRLGWPEPAEIEAAAARYAVRIPESS